ncbi:MAG: TIGR01212 family radical SAM protein [Lentisphaeria bacterium]|nr:TIGR01212 family radical SAM protein [Lentisphaeria bacterium]
MKNLNFFSNYIENKYGKKLYRLPIDLNLGCPNRKNQFGDGCIFCSEDGSKARHLQQLFAYEQLNETEYLIKQVEAGKKYIFERYNDQGPYIAYFQSFTSTFAPLARLKKLYETVLSEADFRVLIIGTRADSLPDEVLEYLSSLSSRYEIWLELGVQTSCDATLKRINRGHDFKCVIDCMKRIKNFQNLHIGCHIILGLPGEDVNTMLRSAEDIAKLGFEAIKLHQLMLLKNTPLYRNFAEYREITPLLNEYEYAEIAKKFLRKLPENILIMRLNADSDLQDIVGPKWLMKKGQFREFFLKYFEEAETENQDFVKIKTNDGSFTMYNAMFKQNFHSMVGAASEAKEKFIIPCKLVERLKKSDCRLLDVGFGLGVNAFGAALEAEKLKSNHLFIDSLELDKRVLIAAKNIYEEGSFELKLLEQLIENGEVSGNFFTIKMYLADARTTIKSLTNKYDMVFHDGFSPDCNIELWSYDFVRELAKHLTANGVICSYSANFAYRGALLRAKLTVGETPAVGRKKGGTISSLSASEIINPLSEKDYKITRFSTAGLPYRDINLIANREVIVSRRKKVFDYLRNHGIPKWYKS